MPKPVKNCLTCQHEPSWHYISPIAEKGMAGHCRRSGFKCFRDNAYFEQIKNYCPAVITRSGQCYFRSGTNEEPVINACPLWDPKPPSA